LCGSGFHTGVLMSRCIWRLIMKRAFCEIGLPVLFGIGLVLMLVLIIQGC